LSAVGPSGCWKVNHHCALVSLTRAFPAWCWGVIPGSPLVSGSVPAKTMLVGVPSFVAL